MDKRTNVSKITEKTQRSHCRLLLRKTGSHSFIPKYDPQKCMLAFPLGNPGFHRIRGSFAPESTSQTASRSNQQLCTAAVVTNSPTDRTTCRPRYSVRSNRPHLCVLKHTSLWETPLPAAISRYYYNYDYDDDYYYYYYLYSRQ